jgi:hypothetical protein
MYKPLAVLTLFILAAGFAVAPPAAAQVLSLAAQSDAPVTYAVDGKQRVSIASGHAIFTFRLTKR